MEEIKDEAVVCRFCKRDLLLMLPMMRRVTTLELKVAQLVDSLSSYQAGGYQNVNVQNSPSPIQKQVLTRGSTKTRFAIAVFCSSCLMALLATLLLTDEFSLSESTVTTVLVLGLGISSSVIGYLYPLSLRVVAVAAFVQPLLSAVLLQAFEYIHSYGGVTQMTLTNAITDAVAMLAFKYVFGWLVVLFFAGIWLGQWLRKIFHGENVPSNIEVRLATKLITHQASETNDEFQRRVARWSSVISGAAPIFTFVASLVTAGLGLLAAFAKASPAGAH